MSDQKVRFPYLYSGVNFDDPNWWVAGEVTFQTAIAAVEMALPIISFGHLYAYDIHQAQQWPDGVGRVVHIDRQRGTALAYAKLGEQFVQLAYSPLESRRSSMTPLSEWRAQSSQRVG